MTASGKLIFEMLIRLLCLVLLLWVFLRANRRAFPGLSKTVRRVLIAWEAILIVLAVIGAGSGIVAVVRHLML